MHIGIVSHSEFGDACTPRWSRCTERTEKPLDDDMWHGHTGRIPVEGVRFDHADQTRQILRPGPGNGARATLPPLELIGNSNPQKSGRGWALRPFFV